MSKRIAGGIISLSELRVEKLLDFYSSNTKNLSQNIEEFCLYLYNFDKNLEEVYNTPICLIELKDSNILMWVQKFKNKNFLNISVSYNDKVEYHFKTFFNPDFSYLFYLNNKDSNFEVWSNGEIKNSKKIKTLSLENISFSYNENMKFDNRIFINEKSEILTKELKKNLTTVKL